VLKLQPATSIRVRCAPDPALRAHLAASREAIEAVWTAERARRGEAVFDGSLLAVTSIARSPAGIEVEASPVSYKAYVAQRQGVPLGLRALGVSGVTLGRWEGRSWVLVGRRASHVTLSPGQLELPPSGSVGEEVVGADGTVGFLAKLLEELEEETGIAASAVTGTAPLGIIEDPGAFLVDVCCRLELAARPPLSPSNEYDELRWVTIEEARLLAAQAPVTPTLPPLVEVLR
jgi:8-oxo-dGTP pyrophosphatase MutT (NUDIX family)